MPTIFYGDTLPDGQTVIVRCDPDHAAKTGRWTYAKHGQEPKQYPDRCEDCWDRDTFAHYPATHYRREVDHDLTVTYYGVCARCLHKYPQAKPLSN